MVAERLGGVSQLLNKNPPAPHPPKKKKGRHSCWILAREEACKLYSKLEDLKVIINNIKDLSKEYQEDIENKAIILRRDDEVLVLEYITRFHEKYLKRVKRKFNRLIKVTKDINGRHTFLTVTFNPKDAMTILTMREIFSKGVSDLIDRIKKKYDFECYIKSFEFTKSGIIHAHILFLNINYIDSNWLSKQLESCKLGKIKKIKEFKGNTEPAIRYFFKYLTKSLKDEKFLALSWALNIRTFSWSRILNVYLSSYKTNFEKLGSGWVYLGVFYWYVDVYGVISYDEFRKYIEYYV